MHFPTSPRAIAVSFWRNRNLIGLLAKREAVGRYQGSILGLLWSFFHPLLMLTVYTFVFSIVFKARWGGAGESRTVYALVLFSGLMVFSLFAECLNRAPALILNNVNYVKKVVFPLEILPWVALGSALFHMIVSLIVWMGFYLIIFGAPPVTVLLFPLVLLPLLLLVMGLSWLLASLGVYIRDVTQIVGVTTSVLMFLTPIFYPLSALPERLQPVLYANPLTLVVEQTRDVLIWGKAPCWTSLGLFILASAVVAWAGFVWFQKTRRGFADVL
ncbi:MAG: ABC transporter permease [Rhodospirillaceae bacterium]|nr:MAG: ABC transporter permease [Rhodospirillaceae bacterium]